MKFDDDDNRFPECPMIRNGKSNATFWRVRRVGVLRSDWTSFDGVSWNFSLKTRPRDIRLADTSVDGAAHLKRSVGHVRGNTCCQNFSGERRRYFYHHWPPPLVFAKLAVEQYAYVFQSGENGSRDGCRQGCVTRVAQTWGMLAVCTVENVRRTKSVHTCPSPAVEWFQERLYVRSTTGIYGMK